MIKGSVDQESPARLNEAFAHFFELLGYGVTYEGRRATGELWHEIYDEAGIICQVPFGTPLADFLADLPFLVEGKSGVAPHTYWCACDDDEKLRGLFDRVRSAKLASPTAFVGLEERIAE
jgi:hypothetical protein